MLKFCFNALADGIVMYAGWLVGIALYNFCF